MAERDANGRFLKGSRGQLATIGHGGYAPTIYEPLAQELVDHMLESRPDLDQPEYAAAVADWAITEIRLQLFRKELAERGAIDGRGKIRETLVKHEQTLARSAREARRILGLDPRAAAELKKVRTDATVAGWDAEAAFDKALALDEARRSRAAIDAASDELAEAGAQLVGARRPEPPKAIEAGETTPQEEGQ